MKTISEVVKLSGVSRRTLQYYDEIGLLAPAQVSPAGYRLYDDENLLRLWRILFYKELGFSLDNIQILLDSSKEEERELFKKHRQIIHEKQLRINKILKSINHYLDGDFDTTMLRDFDISKVEQAKKQYAEMVDRQRQKGDIFYDFFRPVAQYKLNHQKGNIVSFMMHRVSHMDRQKLKALHNRGSDIADAFRRAMDEGPASPEASRAVEDMQTFLNQLFPCDDATMLAIGKAYLANREEVSKLVPGLAEFVNRAIEKHRRSE